MSYVLTYDLTPVISAFCTGTLKEYEKKKEAQKMN